jgi:hypothetical protein
MLGLVSLSIGLAQMGVQRVAKWTHGMPYSKVCTCCTVQSRPECSADKRDVIQGDVRFRGRANPACSEGIVSRGAYEGVERNLDKELCQPTTLLAKYY